MRVLIIAEYGLDRAGLRCLLSRSASDCTVFEVSSPTDLISADRAARCVDVVLLAGSRGPETWRSRVNAVRAMLPDTPIAMLVENPPQSELQAAVSAGVCGFVPADSSARVLASALDLVAQGEIFVPSRLVWGGQIANRQRPSKRGNGALAALSRRQAQVLSLLAAGKTTTTIARDLGIEVATVKNHIQGIFKALNVHSRTQAVLKAIRNGEVQGGV